MVSQLKELDNELENIMTSYAHDTHHIEGENRLLKNTISQLRNEIAKYREPALMVCDVVDLIENKAIVKTPNGNKFCVNISKDCKGIIPGESVLTEQKNLTIIKKIPKNKKFNVEQFVIVERPNIKWRDIGGLNPQIQEIKEVIELPLKEPELFKKIGILPPKGILLYGPPGTGKTLLAKAAAASTKSTFIEIVGSELVQKFIGEGAKLVKEVFQLAREKAPSIIFIDEIDALASKRIEIGTSGEREVQRTFMQFLAELDGFKPLDNVKLIGCTNRKDILDPAVIRPGRLDRLINVPAPDKTGIKEIFKIHSNNMNINEEIQHNMIFKELCGLCGAEIKAIVTEAGYFAIRKNRTEIMHNDFVEAIKKIKNKEIDDTSFIEMFG